MAVGDEAAAGAPLVLALTLLPLGFCLAGAGFLGHVRTRVRRSRSGSTDEGALPDHRPPDSRRPTH
jgi:hypothetical protein